MIPQSAITGTAALIADPARAAMLTLLLDARARPAGELAYGAGVSAQTASSHLAKLLAGGLVTVEREGRHRYYRLAGPQVATLLEHLASIDVAHPVRRKAPDRAMKDLRFARCCYDHLAGSLGVATTRTMLERGYLAPGAGKTLVVSPKGKAWFGDLGIDVGRIAPGRHGIARRCLDWTERRHHLAGPLGTAFLAQTCAVGWFRRSASTRAIDVTPTGWEALRRQFGLDRYSVENHAGNAIPNRTAP